MTEAQGLVEFMESIGFKHKGFEDGLSKHYIQPRMTTITNIDQSDEDLIKSFERNNRSRVKLSQKKEQKPISQDVMSCRHSQI